MQHIRAKDTRPERMLRLALWHKGLRYRKNWRKLPGTPDIALTRHLRRWRLLARAGA